MSMHASKISALMGIGQNCATIVPKAVLLSKTPKKGQFWRIYSTRAYIMVSLSYTSRMEVREDHRTGNK